MARTYGSMNNSRGNEVTAMGAKYAHLRGWHTGVRVQFSEEGEADSFLVYMTSGSNGTTADTYLGKVVQTPDGNTWVPAPERVCIGCEQPKGDPHLDWCPVVTGTLNSLKERHEPDE
jgi:hypothetical protein